MQFHLKVVSIFLKTRVKDRGNSSALLLESKKPDLISMYRGTLVSGFVNISVYFNKLANNF